MSRKRRSSEGRNDNPNKAVRLSPDLSGIAAVIVEVSLGKT